MLFDPNAMPELKKKKPVSRKNRKIDMRQKLISKHKQPSIYVETKVEKRRS